MKKAISAKSTLAFIEDSMILIERGQASLEAARRERSSIAGDIQKRMKERKGKVSAHAVRLLPNLNPRTIQAANETVPRFASRDVRSILSDVPNVPFLVWVTGGGKRYRKKLSDDTLQLLRIKLCALIDSMDARSVPYFTDVAEIDNEIITLQERDADLARTEETLRRQIASLTFAMKADQLPPKKLATAVSQAARRTGRPDDNSDTGNMLLTYMLMQPMLDSMFTANAQGEIAYQPEFQPGDGSFGGAGSSDTWAPDPGTDASVETATLGSMS